MKIIRKLCLLLAASSLVLSGCGDFQEEEVASPNQGELEILAREYLPEGFSESDLAIIDLDTATVYTREGGARSLDLYTSLPGQKEQQPSILAQGTAIKELRRVPTKYGTEAQPFTAIQGTLTLPDEDDLLWLNDSIEDAAFNFFGVQTREGLVVDMGLVSTTSNGLQAGKWYGFITIDFNGTNEGGAIFTQEFGDGLPGGTTVAMKIEAVKDARPNLEGDQPGVLMLVGSVNPFAAIVTGGRTGRIKLDGIDQSMRRVTSIDAESGNKDARMCDSVWSNVLVGIGTDLVAFGEDLAAQPDGNLLAVETTSRVTVKNATSYTAETVDIRCKNSAALIIDDTGSMSQELGAIKFVLDAFIVSGLANNIESWSLVSFKDSVRNFGTTEDADTIRGWVASLFPSGGGACPESSLQAMEQGRQLLLQREGKARQMVLVTDASPNAGDVDGLISSMQSDGIRVHTLLTGDCVSGSVEGFRAQTTGPLSARVVYRRISEETGGLFFFLPGGTQADFENALEEIFESVATTGPPPSRDSEPPRLELSVDPNELWPPNHKMVEINVQALASDNLDPDPEVEFVEVQVNEPDDIQGSGNTDGDIVVDNGRIFLRAERSGTGQRRVYTIIYKATDNAGNSVREMIDVVVPHDRGQGKKK